MKGLLERSCEVESDKRVRHNRRTGLIYVSERGKGQRHLRWDGVEKLLGELVVVVSQSWLELVDPITEARSTPGGQQGPCFVGTYCSTWYDRVEIIRCFGCLYRTGRRRDDSSTPLFNTTTVVGVAEAEAEAEARARGCGASQRDGDSLQASKVWSSSTSDA